MIFKKYETTLSRTVAGTEIWESVYSYIHVLSEEFLSNQIETDQFQKKIC